MTPMSRNTNIPDRAWQPKEHLPTRHNVGLGSQFDHANAFVQWRLTCSFCLQNSFGIIWNQRFVMPQRRSEIPTAMPGPHTYRNYIPRHPDLPQEVDGSYMQGSAPELQHYALTSSYMPSVLLRPHFNGDFDYFPGLDGNGSAPLSACGSTNVANISPPQSDAGSEELLSWATGDPYGMPLPQELALSSVHDAFLIQWPTQSPNTPPPEQLIEAGMLRPQEPTVCEHLGPSALQHMRLDLGIHDSSGRLIHPCSKSRRSPPRPIRPSNERNNSQDNCEDGSGSPSKDKDERPTARTDPLYNTKPDKDGFYHCPHYNDGTDKACKHAPVKQKCIFA